jgi:hypothetical protein
MNYSAVDGLGTSAMLPAVISVTGAGIEFQKARLPNEPALAASMLHNLASAGAPDAGSVTPEQNQIGRDAAIEALALRQKLGNTQSHCRDSSEKRARALLHHSRAQRREPQR